MIQPPTSNQHYIPRFLLKGFVTCVNPKAKNKRKQYFISIGDSMGRLQRINIAEVAYAKDFYEVDTLSRNTVENHLSQLESKYASTLSKIIEERKVHRSQWKNIGGLILQMSYRTASFRDEANRIMGEAMDYAAESVLTNTRLNRTKIANETLFRIIRKKFNRLPTLAEIDKMDREMNSGLPTILRKTRLQMESVNTLGIVREAQGKMLATDTPKNGDRFRDYEWCLNFTSEELILGDSCVLALNDETNIFEAVLSVTRKNTRFVVMPLTYNSYIYGMLAEKKNSFSLPSASVVNDSSAAISNKFVLSRNSMALAAEILERIGARKYEIKRC